MITAAKLAKKCGLDRREMQFLGDKGVLESIEGTGPGTDAPRMFEDTEIEIARILARAPKMSANNLSNVAHALRQFRQASYDRAGRPRKQKDAWQRALDRKKVVLGIVLERHPNQTDVDLPTVYAISTNVEAGRFVFETLKGKPQNKTAFVVDLTDALDYDRNPYD